MYQQDRGWQVLEGSCSPVCACPWQPVKVVDCYMHNVSRINMEPTAGLALVVMSSRKEEQD